jgi:hypothetical protein
LLFELLKRLKAAGYHHHVMGLRCCEQVLGYREANT